MKGSGLPMGDNRAPLADFRVFVDRCNALFQRDESLASLGRRWSELGRRALGEGLCLTVLGEGKKGKSALVNGLLGHDLLPEGRKPCTRVPWRVHQGEDVSYLLRDVAGKVLPLERDGELWQDLITLGGGTRYAGVEAYCPSAFLAAGRRVVDMPGLDGPGSTPETLETALRAADVLLFVVDASYVLTRSEVRVLMSDALSRFHDRMILVLSKGDQLDEAEWKDAESYGREKLEGLGLSIPVVAVTVRGARAGLDRLARLCEERLFRRSHDLLLDGEAERGENLLRDALHRIGEVTRALEDRGRPELDLQGARAALARHEEATRRAETRVTELLGEVKEELHAELTSFAHRFRDALADEIARVPAADVKRYLPFFLRDRFHDWVEGRQGWVELRLQGLLEELRGELAGTAEEISGELGMPEGGGGVDLAFASSTSRYDLGVFAVTAASTVALFVNLAFGGLMTAGAALLALQTKGRKDEEAKAEATRASRQAVLDTADRLGRDFDSCLDTFARELTDALERQRETLAARVEAMAGQPSSPSSEEARRKELEALVATFEECLEELTALREAMWIDTPLEGPYRRTEEARGHDRDA